MSRIIIRASKISKSYKDVVAVDSIDFEICEGETFGFLGPNGAGKTTTMKMIYCFVLPDSGTIEVDGIDVVKKPREVKKILGVVHQGDSLDPDLTVKENLVVYARYFDIPQGISGPRADELIEMMSLTVKKDTVIEELSGGMKRRLMIIRGLINNPKILILDEPTTGLDPQARHLVWQKLRQLKKSGITIILTTHYMDEAAELCDRLVMMHKARIITLGRPDDLIANEIGKEVIEVLEPEEGLLSHASDITGHNGHCEMYGDKLYIYTTDAGPVLQNLDTLGTRHVTRRPADLEDVFLKLAGRGLTD